MLGQIRQEFGLGQINSQEYSPLVLAYLGDCIYETVVRTVLVSRGNRPVDRLNRQASNVSRAAAQAALAKAIQERLTEEEKAIYRRGRNAKSFTKAKNATMTDYRHATGLEALCGYLYLQDKPARLLALLSAGMKDIGLLELPMDGPEAKE